jgi:hypothetical protein
MKYGQSTVDQVRFIMGRSNPVPASAPSARWHESHARETYDRIMAQAGAEVPDSPSHAGPTSVRLPRRPMSASGRARRIIAPITAALAVAGVIAGVTLTANSGNSSRRSATGASTAPRKIGSAADSTLPAFYVTLSLQSPTGVAVAEVHSSQTGRVLSAVNVGYFWNGINISADGSDRAFVVEAAATDNINSDKDVLSLLRISADGTSIKLTRLPITLLPANSPDVVDGIAVSPDGTKLAVALQINQNNSNVLKPHGEIVLYSMKTDTAGRTWTAPGDPGLPWNPAWTGGDQKLNFVWQDQIRGNKDFYTGRSQVRTLNTASPASNLLSSSTVLVSGGGRVGFIQAAYAGPVGAPIIAATFRVTSVGGSGTATVQLIELSATGVILKVFAQHTNSYSGDAQEASDVAGCQVAGVDASALATLAYCTNFGSISNGTFTRLAHNPSGAAAAW